MLTKFLKDAAFTAGVTLSGHTESPKVLDLIGKLKPQNCEKELIRIGSDRDGGYLIPDDLEGIQYCFSAGVGTSVDFENHLANLDVRSFLADFSIDRPPLERPEFRFDKKYIGANDANNFLTIKSWKEKYLPDFRGEMLLKMDIEGAEYEVLLSTAQEVIDEFRIIVAEFHYLHRIFDPLVYGIYRACFERILANFSVVHIHPNNCCGSVRKGEIEIPRVMEFTFYNKSRAGRTNNAHLFPHPLDRDNVAANKPLPLPRCWYGATSVPPGLSV